MFLVVSADGFFLSKILRGILRYKNYYFSPIILDILYEIHAKCTYETVIAGLGSRGNIIQILDDYNYEDVSLILIGKSYGAKQIAQVLKKKKYKFKKIHFICVDAEWITRVLLKIFGIHLSLKVPEITSVLNLRQVYDKKLGGTKIITPTKDFKQRIIISSGTDHFTIVNKEYTRRLIRDKLKYIFGLEAPDDKVYFSQILVGRRY